MGKAEKVASLKQHGALNPRPEKVADAEFLSSEFFDANDLVQVKYEMVRRVRQQGQSVTQVAAAFGVSRTAYYETQAAFEEAGLPGLMPRRPGPRGAHKMGEEVLAFLEQTMVNQGTLRPQELSSLVEERFGLSVHPRTIERALDRRKKKPTRKGTQE
jgi:transposase